MSEQWIIVYEEEWGSDIPYSGPGCEEAQVEPGLVYDDYEAAIADAASMSRFAPGSFVPQPYPFDGKPMPDDLIADVIDRTWPII